MLSADTPAGSAVPRRVLGQHLRELRQQAGLTVKLAATLMEWSEPKLWRIETGQTALRALDVQAMCTAYGAAPGLTQALAGLAATEPGRTAGGAPTAGPSLMISASTPPWRTLRARSRDMRPARSQACCAPRRSSHPHLQHRLGRRRG